MYDVIIIGAGPAGLFAAHELSKKRLKVLVIDKGKDIKSRKDYLAGVGGAGLFSDGKLNLTPIHGKTNLLEFLKRNDADKLIDYIDKVLMRFGATKEFFPKDVKKVKQLQARAKKHGIGLLNVKHKHLGSDKLKKIIKRFVDNLKDFGVKFMLNAEV